MSRALIAIGVLAGACATGGEGMARYRSVEDGISFAPPADWRITRERATIVLDHGDATIGIRVVPRSGWSVPRDAANVFPAVETFLRGLPGSSVTGPIALDGAPYRAVAYDVELTAPGPTRRRYQRHHVTLIADTHVIHVFLVAPHGQLAAGRGAFDTIVKTIQEEG